MENIIENKELNIKSIEKDPLYYGSFLNTARNNMMLIANHLTNRFKEVKCEIIKKEDDFDNEKHFLLTVFDTEQNNLPDERRLGILNYILKRNFFPVLRFFKDKSDNSEKPDLSLLFKEIHNFLTVVFKELKTLRNDYTHYLSIDKTTKEEKQRKNTLDAGLAKTLTQIFKSTFKFSAEQHSQTLEISDFEHLKNYKLFETATNKMTKNGFYFFVCLFLERADGIRFLKKFRGFKNETVKPFLATIKAFTHYAVKVPSVKFVNEDYKQILLTQMLTELNKCPKELYSHLTESKQKEFEPQQKSDEAIEEIIKNSINDDSIDEKEITELLKNIRSLKRHSDRFPYFALRYIDETNAFKNIRFQVSLGKLFIEEYPKTINKEEQNRRITKEIKAFGKLSYFENREDEVLNELKKIYKNEDIYFEQYAPHYNIKQNKIGIFIFDENSEVKNKLEGKPSAFISMNDLPKLITLILLNGNPEEKIKKFVNETNNKILDFDFLKEIRNRLKFKPAELTRRIFNDTGFITDKNSKEQKKYSDFIKNRRKQADYILKEHNIRANQLPSEVADYLLKINKAESKKIIHYAIKRMRFETKQLLKKIKKETAKPKEEQKLKLGELATTLARDIIDMVIDKNVKEKITAPYYNKLQNKLAYFSVSKKEIIEICRELNLFDKNKGHVFLTEKLINKSSGIVNFYINYFEEKQGIKKGFKTIRKGWFDNLQKTYRENGRYKTDYVLDKPGVKIPYILSKLQEKPKTENDFKKWLKNKAKMPVNLPVNLFDDDFKKLFRKKNIKNVEKKGFSQLLAEYLKNDIQPYYFYKRIYEFDFKNLSSKEIKKLAGNKAERNEKLIRFYQSKDRVMKLMCDMLIKTEGSLQSENPFLLKEIYPASEISPLDKPASFSKKIEFNSETFTIIANNDYKPEEQEGYTWTIKDFGIINRIATDRRLDLLFYFEDKNNIPFEHAEHELKEYNRYRDKIFEEISKIEKAIYEKDKDGLIKIHTEKSKYDNLQFYVYLKWLKEKNIEFDETYIREIRNKFSHNQFPRKKITNLKITKQQSTKFMEERNKKNSKYISETYKSLSKQIYETYKQKTEKILEEINKL